ncbi:MAG: guanylate kinase [Ruminococcaceae bacterium]|nr:guanylate kinase [Oscillospiraceae bacterium]
MSRRFRMSTALDVDDLLMECVPYAIKLANEKYKFDPPLTIYEVDRWGKLGTRADVIFEFFDDPEFFKNQPVIEGAKEFVRKLSKMTEVFICTSIVPKFMGIRAQRIMDEFPEIPAEHIYMGSRKDKLNVDILFDDGMHNVFRSNAAYPILMRRPWNQSATGMLAVNNYDEFLKLVEVITTSYTRFEDESERPNVVTLVGPSGSGKTDIAKLLLERCESFEKLVSYTTKDPTTTNINDWYNYVSKKRFFDMMEKGQLFESTMYAGHGYGSKREDVERIISGGKIVLAAMDICGAMSLKTNFSNVVTVYIKRDKRDLLSSILNKKCSNEDKVNRIISIDDEKRNEEICDFVIENTDPSAAADKILDLLGLNN